MNELIKFLSKKENEIYIWICNIGAEREWGNDKNNLFGDYNYDFIDSIGEVNYFFCEKSDYIIVRNKPDDAFFEKLAMWGISKPNVLVVSNNNAQKSLTDLILEDENLLNYLSEIATANTYLLPYAVTDNIEKISQKSGIKIIGPCSKLAKVINNKIFARSVSKKLGFKLVEGQEITNYNDISDDFIKFLQDGKKMVIKRPCCASGLGMYLVDNIEACKSTIKFLKRHYSDEKIIIEKWHEKRIDVNYQIYISSTGEIDVFSIKNQIVKGTTYVGSIEPSNLTNDFLCKYIEYGEKIGQHLFSLGYIGFLNVDSIIVDEEIIPIIEINGRLSLSTYFYKIRNDINKKFISNIQFDIKLKKIYSYEQINQFLSDNKIPNADLLIYSPSALPNHKKQKGEYYYGRLFLLVAFDDMVEFERLLKNVKNIINKIQE